MAPIVLHTVVASGVIVLLTATVWGDQTETEVKAAFLYHFTNYVTWPEEAFSGRSAPFVIGVLGKGAILPALRRTIQGKSWNGRPFVVRAIEPSREARECHLVFVERSEMGRFAQLIEALGNAPVLTVGESEGFIQRGGMINFYLHQNRIRFEINPDTARSRQLSISSKLLNLARITRQ